MWHITVYWKSSYKLFCWIAVALHIAIPFSFGIFFCCKSGLLQNFHTVVSRMKTSFFTSCVLIVQFQYVAMFCRFCFPAIFFSPLKGTTLEWVSKYVLNVCVRACARHSCRLRVVIETLMMIFILGLSALICFVLLLMIESCRWLFLFWWVGISTGPLKLIWIRHINFCAKLRWSFLY